MKNIKVFLLILVLISIFVIQVEAYSEQDLWILEIIMNENYAMRQAVDSLVLDDEVFLPVVEIANMLEVKLTIDDDKYFFYRPGDNKEVKIDVNKNDILLEGKSISDCSKMHLINGKLFLSKDYLAFLFDAQFEYDQTQLNVNIESKHLFEAEKDTANNIIRMDEENEETEDIPKFTLSNITYDWKSVWEKTNFDSDEEEITESKEDWNLSLNLNAKGTLFDWRYYLGLSNQLDKDHIISTDLTNFTLVYDMDQATLTVGKLGVRTEEELVLDNTQYIGLSLVSSVSPLMSSGGNVIQIKGEAEADSKATLYVNGWETDTQKVGEDETYYFKDVLVYQQQRANELRVEIEKSSGEIENIYRYITVSDAVLNKDEVNYLTQAGKIESDNYLFNSIVYWGATKRTTLGLGLYSEFDLESSIVDDNPIFTYNSFQLNQKLGDKLLFKGKYYQNHSKRNNESDTGYRIGLEYQDRLIQSGVEYHYQAEQLNYEEDDRINPNKIFKYYYIQDVTPRSVLEGKYTNYSEINNPDFEEDLYEIGYKIREDRWKGSINFTKSIQNNMIQTESDSIVGSFSYLITPNIELINELGYESMLDEVLSESVNYGIKGSISREYDSYLVSINWDKDLTSDQVNTAYKVSWGRVWPISDKERLRTNLGYKNNINDNEVEIPLGVEYSYKFPDDKKFKLNYQAVWKKENSGEKTDHRIMASFGGAFNFFDGEFVSTSPMAFGGNVGLVSGVVFRDDNRNGLYDDDEILLSNIPVKLGRKVQYTNEEGEFIFKQVSAGPYKLAFDYNQLPIELTPLTTEKNIRVKANGSVKENLGLYVIGTVDGEININNYDENLSLAGIRLVAEPGGYETTTDYSGYYFFDQLPVGEYEIKIVKETLPDWAKLESDNIKNIVISDKGEYITNQSFEIKVKAEKLKSIREEDNSELSEVEVIEPITTKKEEKSKTEDKIKEENIIKREILSVLMEDELFWAPIREIAEAFDARVAWNNQKKEVYIIDEDSRVLFNVKLGYAVKNGEKADLKGIKLKDAHTFITIEDLYLLDIEPQIKDDKLILIKEK